MNKEFIPYEQALELKELGFDEPCGAFYDKDLGSIYQHYAEFDISNDDVYYNDYKLECTAPLYQQAFRWFREKHGWIGGVRNLDRKNPMIVADFVKDEDNLFMIWADNYEDAELKALKELIERIKTK
jgi:hypothetical protein